MLIGLLLVLAVSGSGNRLPPITRDGFCAGKLWIDLAQGEYAQLTVGTDTWIYHVRTRQGRNWTAGGYANAPPIDERHGVGPIAFRRAGYLVRRASFFGDAGEGRRSYLIHGASTLPSGEEISYYDANTVILKGDAFSWTARDGAFFDRIHADADAKRKCSLFWKRMS